MDGRQNEPLFPITTRSAWLWRAAAAIARALVEAASSLVDGAEGGTHHLSGLPDTSWADLAREIMAQAALPCRIDDIRDMYSNDIRFIEQF